MRLYHFTSQKYGLLALKQRRLKIARINELNDPFEFLGWNLRDKRVRAFMRNWKNERDREFGIVCFSRKWSHPMLWGHYAEKHHGMAIGFDVPDGNDTYHPVKYRRARLPAPSDREIISADVDDLLLTKFTAWRYESEYRCFSLSYSRRSVSGPLWAFAAAGCIARTTGIAGVCFTAFGLMGFSG